MKKLCLAIFAIALFTTACKTDKKTQKNEEVVTSNNEVVTQKSVLDNATHEIDAATSTLTWKGFKPTGTHYGTVPIKDGGVVYNNNALQQGQFVMNLSELTVDDIPADDDMHGKLVGHLKSVDFFDTANYATADFTFTEVKDGNLIGSLTIKNITKPVSIPVKVSEANGIIRIQADPFKIDRTEYDIKYKSNKFFDNLKDKFINDEFEVSFDVMLK